MVIEFIIQIIQYYDVFVYFLTPTWKYKKKYININGIGGETVSLIAIWLYDNLIKTFFEKLK